MMEFEPLESISNPHIWPFTSHGRHSGIYQDSRRSSWSSDDRDKIVLSCNEGGHWTGTLTKGAITEQFKGDKNIWLLIFVPFFPSHPLLSSQWPKENHNHHHHRLFYEFFWILLIENYDQGLGREGRRQLIPIKESAAKESLRSRKIHKWIHWKNLSSQNIKSLEKFRIGL